MKKILKILIISVIICFTTYWSLSILKCEYLTFMHKNEFNHIKEINESSMVKIIEYNDNYARVYCINYNVHNGTICRLIKEDGLWVFDVWGRCIWSKYGSADGFIWPYGR